MKKANSDVLNFIKENAPSLSKRQKIAAEYIIKHCDKAAYMTAAQLGKSAGVSEATVVRLASRLGFSSYRELQRNLREVIRNRVNSVQRMELADKRIGSGDILTAVLKSDVEKILTNSE